MVTVDVCTCTCTPRHTRASTQDHRGQMFTMDLHTVPYAESHTSCKWALSGCEPTSKLAGSEGAAAGTYVCVYVCTPT